MRRRIWIRRETLLLSPNSLFERAHGGEFAVDLVGAGEQDARRLFAQDIAPELATAVCDQEEGGVRGAALELVNVQVFAEVLDAFAQVRIERGDVEAMGRRDLADREATGGFGHAIGASIWNIGRRG